MLPGRRTSGWILKQMASGCKRLDTSCSSPHPHPNTHHTVLSPNRLGFPEACPGCRLPTRKIAVRADSPTPTQGPGSGSGSLQIPIHPPSQELSSPEHLGPRLSALGLGNAHGGKPLPGSPTCMRGWCFPLFLSWQKVWACALGLWLVSDKLVDFESCLISGL